MPRIVDARAPASKSWRAAVAATGGWVIEDLGGFMPSVPQKSGPGA
ncbi:MAG TPA: hypothetical protein QGF58_18910 [Myxococcota bacterium]|nr:hypothetical protein [Myxococcota bacterium]